MGLDPSSVDHAHLVGEGGPTGHLISRICPPRWYFELVPESGDAWVIGKRSLHLTTAGDFRDIGGHRSQDGRWVRMGLAYQSNGLDHLTDAELARLEKLKIKLVCDLRTAEEVRRGPDRVP